MADIPESTKSEHVVWTVDATSYLRNLDSEDLRAETFAVHHQAAPEETETGTRISLRFPTLIVSCYCSEPREVADRVARILNAHWDEPAAPPAMDREAVARIIIGPRNPVPVRSRLSLRELQDIRWAQVTKQEQREALWIADAILSTLSADAIRQGEGVSDADLKDAVTELLSHRGERPYRILRGGSALWETWVPSFRAAIRYLPTTPASHASNGGKA